MALFLQQGEGLPDRIALNLELLAKDALGGKTSIVAEVSAKDLLA